MSETTAPGPEVDFREDLYRGLTTPAWWVAEEKRPSSAAFRYPNFSVDVASLAGSPDYTLAHLPVGSGLVSFNYGRAKALGFTARPEPDPAYPENQAHANVYSSSGTSKRKAMAQKLVTLCTVVREPSFVS